jgi:ATP-dependent exoDNAse (exonuclease V) alpha subunit
MSGANTFITGGGGVGKSFITQILIHALQKERRNVMVCAPTGVAATHIGGTTIHRAFALPTGPCITEKKMQIMAHTTKAMRVTDVIIIDEISMCRIDMFDAIVASIEKVEKKTKKRIQLVVVGDFCQLPPVVAEGSGEREFLESYYGHPIRGAYAFMAPGWRRMGFRVVQLNEIVRQKDPEFAANLNRLRMGDSSVLDYFNTNSAKCRIKDAISLHPYNRQVDNENHSSLDAIQEDPVVFETMFDGELSSTDYSGVSRNLTLKRGARILFTSNDGGKCADVIRIPGEFSRRGKNRQLYINGTTGTVLDICRRPDDPDKDILIISVDDGEIIELSRQRYPVYEYVAKGEKLSRHTVGHYYQFPIRLAYALTIHKAQGQTYKRVNVDPACFSSGQLYVALSRATDIQSMYLTAWLTPENLILDPDVKGFYESAEAERMMGENDNGTEVKTA